MRSIWAKRRGVSGLAAALLAMAAAGAAPAQTTSPTTTPPPLPPAGYVFQPAAPCVEDAERAAKPGRPGLAMFEVCADQMALLAKGLADAKASGKLLLVTFGATWCPWCATLQRLMPGPELLGRKGDALDYGATFHHIEIGVSTLHKGQKADIPSGEAVLGWVLKRTPDVKIRAIPFLAVIDPASDARVWARNIDDTEQKSKTEHDPARVRAVLVEAHDYVRKGTPMPGEPGWLKRKWHRFWNG